MITTSSTCISVLHAVITNLKLKSSINMFVVCSLLHLFFICIFHLYE